MPQDGQIFKHDRIFGLWGCFPLFCKPKTHLSLSFVMFGHEQTVSVWMRCFPICLYSLYFEPPTPALQVFVFAPNQSFLLNISKCVRDTNQSDHFNHIKSHLAPNPSRRKLYRVYTFSKYYVAVLDVLWHDHQICLCGSPTKKHDITAS